MYGLTFLSIVTCVCDPATQFTCDNAFCIDLDKKCDDIADCRDRSDERGCILSKFHKTVNKKAIH